LRKFLIRFPVEAVIWLGALIALACINPEVHTHFTLCPLNNLGIDWCPGCGLGRAVSLLFHGEVVRSFQMHPLGIFAVAVLLYRSLCLIKKAVFHSPLF
jgi:hypothetical protein